MREINDRIRLSDAGLKGEIKDLVGDRILRGAFARRDAATTIWQKQRQRDAAGPDKPKP